MYLQYDVVVVGAGPAGIVAARKLADKGKKILIIEKRKHIAGNCFDYFNERGVIVQKYGPHIFHTDMEHVWNFLSEYTEWNYYQHEVLGFIDGRLIPIPFNLNSLGLIFPDYYAKKIEERLITTYGINRRIPIGKLLESDDELLHSLANYVHDKVFKNYSNKQWGQNIELIDSKVYNRVPIVISRDNRYFSDIYQGIPVEGYTNLFEKMIDHPLIHTMLNTNSHEVLQLVDGEISLFGQIFTGTVIYTGPIDDLLDYQFGPLPYRSLNLHFENYDLDYYQENSLINYPNNYLFTRITEFKYFQKNRNTIQGTTICREYPQDYIPGKNIPYYVVNNNSSQLLYQKYLEKLDIYENLYLLGRLANYQYFDMDDIIDLAIKTTEIIETNT